MAMLKGLATLPEVLELVKDLQRQIACLTTEVRASRTGTTAWDGDGWLDAKSAARHMGISAATFDKYRYQTTPKIKGFALDGKILYQKSDLDLFIRTYEAKSRGMA